MSNLNKQDIINILKKNFSSVYCDTCNAYLDADKCEWCHRKYMNWGISDESAEDIAEEIIACEN